MLRLAAIVIVSLFFIALLSGTRLGAGENTHGMTDFRERSARISESETASQPWTLYSPDPTHIWNRLYRVLYERVTPDGTEVGYDELDPLLWSRTKYLLVAPGNNRAITVLDEFLSTHAERQITDPLKRAILQRDLWAIFDWTAHQQANSVQVSNLQVRLVRVMRRLALSPEQVDALPDTYRDAVLSRKFATTYNGDRPEQPFLPPDLFESKGSWIGLRSRGTEPVAPVHTDTFSGRSVYREFIRLPQGRTQTLKYLEDLANVPIHWIADKSPSGAITALKANPNVPQFPAGTQLALVRQMAVINTRGDYQPTRIIESVQIRVHHVVGDSIPRNFSSNTSPVSSLHTYEFRVSRPMLFALENGGGLRAIEMREKEFALFLSHDIDFEQRSTLEACMSCHAPPGVYSIRSHQGDVVPSDNFNGETEKTQIWKSGRSDWALLQRLWRNQEM